MKHVREIKVAVLAIGCIFLLYFGFNYLKGIDIFSPAYTYIGHFANIQGLTEQSPVYVRGYKVGQVDAIHYDFSQKDAFEVYISVDKSIRVPMGGKMVLAADGLLGGKAINLVVPEWDENNTEWYASNDTLPTGVELGLIESLEAGLLAHVDSLLCDVDSLVGNLKHQLEGDHISRTLQNVDRISSDLTTSSADIRQLTHQRVPVLMDSIQKTVNGANAVLSNIEQANVKATIAKVDTALDVVTRVLNTKDGTLGLLLNDKDLYYHIDATVQSADSLIVDLKAHPKRYVHFSLFGAKDKQPKKQSK